MCIYALVVASFLAIAGLFMGKNLSELSILCGVFVTGAFGGKVGSELSQKKVELPISSEDEK